MPIDRETQKALLRKVIDKLQQGQDNDVKNSNHIADEVVTGNQLVADRVDYLRQTITGEAKKQEKDGKKGKGDAAEDARENRNLLSKIGNGISGLAQSTKDTAKAAASGAVSGGKGLLESMGKMLKGGLIGGGALLAGAGLLAGGAGMLIDSLNDMDADAIKEKVKTLLSIKDDVGGAGNFFLQGGAFLVAMTGIGLGLAVFSVGSTVAGMSQGLLDYFGQSNFAEGIKQNVVTLLSISDELGGNLNMLADGGAFLLAMTGVALGLAVFGLGSGVAGISSAMDLFTGGSFADGIKQNVLTLLSIKDELGGNLNMLADGGAFMLAMTGIGSGLAVFGLGSAIAGIASAMELFQSGAFAENIKTNVLTLLSIKDELGGNLAMLADGGAFGLAMTGIGLGLAAFGIGSILNSFTADDFGASVKENVLQLLSIPDEVDGDIEEKASKVNNAMGHLSAGLTKFSGGTFVSALANAGASILNFLTGGDSPIDQMLALAEKDAEIASTERNITRMVSALERFSALNLTGPTIDFTKLIGGVATAIPFIQALGGTHPDQEGGNSVTLGGNLFGGGIEFGPHGILDEGLKIPEVAEKIAQVQGALGYNVNVSGAGATGAMAMAYDTSNEQAFAQLDAMGGTNNNVVDASVRTGDTVNVSKGTVQMNPEGTADNGVPLDA